MNPKIILYLALVLSGGLLDCCVTASALGEPPPPPGPNLPGVSKGKIETYWLAPYVQASERFGGTTITWFAESGHVKEQAAVDSIEPGFVTLIGRRNVLRGVNEDWNITLPHIAGTAGYITSTPDSRVFINAYHSKPGRIALDIYVHGKLANTIGPFLQYLGRDVELNDDGSATLIVWKDESHMMAQVMATDPNGVIRFRVDCGQEVNAPIVAPDGAGVLLNPNTGGSDQNTFMWYTREGKLCSMEISPNPYCVGWIPKSCKSLFSTGMGDETKRYRLIDWETGKGLWDIPCPGNGKALAVGFTPQLIIFAVAELYQPGPWRGAEWPLRNGGKEWIRTFYAVSLQDGSLVARWQPQYPQRVCEEDRDSFLRLGNKLFYVTAGEFVELNLEDILSKKNGWR
jgi:hypothetical protein